MIRMTQIARGEDGLVLVGSVERQEVLPDRKEFERQAKSIFKELQNHQKDMRMMTLENPPNFSFHVLLTEDVFYLALCDKKFPAKLAFGYLDDLRKEFESVHGQQVASARSVYSMQKFEPYISRAKKVFSDFRSQKDLEQVNSDLSEVHNVMKRSIQEVLGRGEKLSDMQNLSSALQEGSSQFKKQSTAINRAAMIRKWAVFLVPLLLFVFFLLYVFVF